MLIRALLLIDDRTVRRRVNDIFKGEDVLIDQVRSKDEVYTLLSREGRDLLLISRSVLGESPGDFLALVRDLPDGPDVIVLSEQEDSTDRAMLLAHGCIPVLAQELPTPSLRSVLDAVMGRRRRRQPQSIDRSRELGPARLADFSSRNEVMKNFMAVVERVATSNTTLLILGETGVGKERLARAIHNESLRTTGPFVAVNCAALTETLLESELFGHEEGAFSGATRSRRGCFELAHKGTLFLDEVGEMPLHLQVKLLRVLQEREVLRVGGERPIPVDVRVMAASHREIQDDVDAGKFRKDLFYRLSVVSLRIPPLRERREDIPPLIESYVHIFCSQMTHHATRVSPEAMRVLTQYDWPGNVRELVNVVERAMLLCPHDEIGVKDLPADLRGESRIRRVLVPGSDPVENLLEAGWKDRSLHELMEHLEKSYLRRILRESRGRIGVTAARAGIDPRVLYEKMKRHKLNKNEFK